MDRRDGEKEGVQHNAASPRWGQIITQWRLKLNILRTKWHRILMSRRINKATTEFYIYIENKKLKRTQAISQTHDFSAVATVISKAI